MFRTRDPSGNSREKTVQYIDLLVSVGELSDAVNITRSCKRSEHDMEMFNCFLDNCQQGDHMRMKGVPLGYHLLSL